MKKLLTILLACSMMTFAFASCGDDKKDDDDSSKKSSVSDSADEDEDSKDESSEDESSKDESSKDESSKEDSSESESSVNESSSATPATFSVLNGDEIDSALVGVWTSDELYGASIEFGDDNVMGMSLDYSSMMCFKNNALSMSGVEYPATFDGSTLSVDMDGISGIVMERTGAADASTMDGEYLLTGGQLYDSLASSLDASTDIILEIAGESLILKMDICKYAADGDQMEICGDSSGLFSTDGQETVCDYTVSGDSLTMTSDGEEVALTKVK